MTKSASSLASSSFAVSPLRRLDARVGCWGSRGFFSCLFFFGLGLHCSVAAGQTLPEAEPLDDLGHATILMLVQSNCLQPWQRVERFIAILDQRGQTLVESVLYSKAYRTGAM